jgi:hypothetical protein
VTYHLYVRNDYAEPLARFATFEHDTVPTLDDLPVERDPDWLEVVVVPDEAITWVLRDADLVTESAPEEVPA